MRNHRWHREVPWGLALIVELLVRTKTIQKKVGGVLDEGDGGEAEPEDYYGGWAGELQVVVAAEAATRERRAVASGAPRSSARRHEAEAGRPHDYTGSLAARRSVGEENWASVTRV